MVSGIILLGLMAWYDFMPGWRFLTLPLFITVAFAASMYYIPKHRSLPNTRI